MGIIDSFKKIFRAKRQPDEIEKLNMECNVLFEKTFNTCRLDFGSGLMEIMKIKQSIIEKALSDECYIPAKELLAKRALSLIEVYLKLAQGYVDFKNSMKDSLEDNQAKSHLDEIKRKLDETFSLVKSLNIQICSNAINLEINNDFDEAINEAEALNNVLNDSKNKNNI